MTIHEGPDGMFLVPTDVHDKVNHSGYVSKLKDVLDGKDGAEKALDEFKVKEKENLAAKIPAKKRGKASGPNCAAV